MTQHVGIDFGTTNSAVAVAIDGQAPKLLTFPGLDGERLSTWRSVLFFEEGQSTGRPEVSAGKLAIGRYLDSGGDGRFIQSVKSHLASRLFRKTSILNRNYSLADLVSTYLLQMREKLDVDLGDSAVVGRPVRYWGADSQEDDARAIERMREGLAQAGFHNVIFEYEPSAAAAKYASEQSGEKTVLIADFGGGTSDFCLLQISPDSPSKILSTGGIGIGGDTFDGAIVDSLVAPKLGKGMMYRDPFGGETEVPKSIYSHLRRWHHLAFLKSAKTMALLDRIGSDVDDPSAIARLIHLVEHDLGLPLHQSVEQCKVRLSSSDSDKFAFTDPPISIGAPVQRSEFETWIDSDLNTIDSIVDELLQSAGLKPEKIDCVFTTGGSSFVPALRARLEDRFPGKLQGGEEMTSVALGLAERAREEFAA